MKKFIFIIIFFLGLFWGFILADYWFEQKSCKYYIMRSGEKLCMTKEVKQVVEDAMEGNISRLKSERTILESK